MTEIPGEPPNVPANSAHTPDMKMKKSSGDFSLTHHVTAAVQKAPGESHLVVSAFTE